jgi:hypothetical protein
VSSPSEITSDEVLIVSVNASANTSTIDLMDGHWQGLVHIDELLVGAFELPDRPEMLQVPHELGLVK